jgi:hypothetical protein
MKTILVPFKDVECRCPQHSAFVPSDEVSVFFGGKTLATPATINGAGYRLSLPDDLITMIEDKRAEVLPEVEQLQERGSASYGLTAFHIVRPGSNGRRPDPEPISTSGQSVKLR